MRLFTIQWLVWLLALTTPVLTFATHQVGGQLEMQAIGDVPGHFRIIVTNYLENGTQGIARQASSGSYGIYRIRDNALMDGPFTVQQTGTKDPVVYANTYCASQRNLNFVVWTYQGIIQLSPSRYDDPQGYYISYQTRNRNAGIDNISSPDQTGFTFYLEFPALVKNGNFVTNSSPHFGTINGEYVCIGEPFTFPFGGIDADGDELRYSMVTPLNQKGTGQNAVSAGPYPDVSWLPGFNADNAIPGSPTLGVNARTGMLSVTATKLGLFVFAVKVEEYRNGVKIGEVRRDFQFLVVDCPPQTTPEPAVQIVAQPTLKSVTICQGDSTLLQAAANANWNYQWRLNGINIIGATKPSLMVRSEGIYMVVVSPKNTCSKTGNSEELNITVSGSKARMFEGGHLCATTGTVQLSAKGAANATYQWYRDGQVLTGQTTDSYSTTQPGRFWATVVDPAGCKVNSDTAAITRSAAVQAALQSASGQNRICPQSTLTLQGSGGLTYTWQKDGVAMTTNDAQYIAKESGTYSLTAADGYGCTGTTSLSISQLPSVTIKLDSIPGVCGSNVPDYSLVASPPGGVFAGDGVTNNVFSAAKAGVGNHAITYTVKAAPECAGVVATQTAVVAPIPTIQLADAMTTYKGNTFTLDPVYTGNPTQFQWNGSTYLDDSHAANPVVTNIDSDITYILSVQNSTGCRANDTIRITVLDRLWIPDAFSPNGDGMNDVWDLPGIEAFPNAIVTVFNRWGEIIFSSDKGYTHPFDGTLNGTSLPSGVYAYTLRTVPERPVIRGSLFLVR